MLIFYFNKERERCGGGLFKGTLTCQHILRVMKNKLLYIIKLNFECIGRFWSGSFKSLQGTVTCFSFLFSGPLREVVMDTCSRASP